MAGLTEKTLATERKYTGKIISVDLLDSKTLGIIAFGESASALRIASAALIVAGIVGLKLTAK